MTTIGECFCEAEARSLRSLIDSFGFERVERTVVDDGTLGTFGSVRYAASGGAGCPTPRGWSVVLSVAPFRLELGLNVADESGASYGLDELHRLMGAGEFPRRSHPIYEAARDQWLLQAESARLAYARKRVR